MHPLRLNAVNPVRDSGAYAVEPAELHQQKQSHPIKIWDSGPTASGMCRRHGFYAATFSFLRAGKKGHSPMSSRLWMMQPEGGKIGPTRAGKLFGCVSLNDRCAAHKLICLCWQIDGGNGFIFLRGMHKSPVFVGGVCEYYMTAFWQVDFGPSGYTIHRLI